MLSVPDSCPFISIHFYMKKGWHIILFKLNVILLHYKTGSSKLNKNKYDMEDGDAYEYADCS